MIKMPLISVSDKEGSKLKIPLVYLKISGRFEKPKC